MYEIITNVRPLAVGRATLREAWVWGHFGEANDSVTLKNPDGSTQTFDSYSAFTTYVEENT